MFFLLPLNRFLSSVKISYFLLQAQEIIFLFLLLTLNQFFSFRNRDVFRNLRNIYDEDFLRNVNGYMFKVNNKDTRTTSMTSFCVSIVNFEHIPHLALVFLLLTLNK